MFDFVFVTINTFSCFILWHLGCFDVQEWLLHQNSHQIAHRCWFGPLCEQSENSVVAGIQTSKNIQRNVLIMECKIDQIRDASRASFGDRR